ncbi:MAG TPA: MFS transporter [Acidimicrobiales bacterium]|nr:MFS transporter [Acidimicrobiales bacterium]
MTLSTLGPAAADERSWGLAFGRRQLAHYPDRGRRFFYLGIVVLTTIVLYYLYYVEGAVTPLLLPSLHMSFRYFLYLLVISNAIGAFSAFIGGLSDRVGRANLTIYGTLAVGLVQLLAVPHVHTKFAFSVAYCVIGFVEGVILVSTPALIRDFSPQMGRASAMGFWALGPTIGSLAASEVATRTLPHLHPWQDQFVISGFVCLAVVLIAFFGLRELAPGLRDQLMVSEHERALVEARARGIDVAAATSHPLRSMLKLDLIASSVGISLFLLIYYASVSVLTLYWVVVFNRSTAQANGINTWYWAFDAATLVGIGVLSDRLRVRKPFMVLGAAGAVVMTVLLEMQAGHPHASYDANVGIVVLLGVAIGCAYTPWMAAYTERVEAHNPALAATGLAVWGWILRIAVALSFVVLPRVITTSTTLVDNQASATALQAIEAARPYAPPATAGAPVPAPAPAPVLAGLRAIGPPGVALANLTVAYDSSHNLLSAFGTLSPALQRQALGLLAFEPLAAGVQVGQPVSAAQLAGVAKNSPQLATLLQAEERLVPAQKASPSQWQRWWWVCIGGQLVFLALVFTMRGRWSPRAARRDFEEHEQVVRAELQRLRAGAGALAESVGRPVGITT